MSHVVLGITMLLLVPLIPSTPKHKYSWGGGCLKNPDALVTLNVFSFPSAPLKNNVTVCFLQRQPQLTFFIREEEELLLWCMLIFFS